MDAAAPGAGPKGQRKNAVVTALKYPFAGVSGMLKRRADRAAEAKQQKQREQSAVEMLDFTQSVSSYHRKTASDSSVGTTDSREGL